MGRTYYINHLPADSDTPFTRDTVDHLRWNEDISSTLMWIGANPVEDNYNPLNWREPGGENNGADNSYPELGSYITHNTGNITYIPTIWDAAKIGNLLKQRNITVPRYSVHSLVYSYETAQANAAFDLWKQIAWLAPSKGDIITLGPDDYAYQCRILDIHGTVAKVMFMTPLIMPDDGYYPTGEWPDTSSVGTNIVYEGSTPQTLINAWVNDETFPADLKNALVAHDFKMSYFNNDTTSWSITGPALGTDFQLRASRFTANQNIVPLTLNDVVDYCGVDNDLDGNKIVSMLGMNYSENYPVQLMSITDNNYLFYASKTSGQITTDSNTASAIYPVAYIDLNFLTTTVDNVGWSLGSRETSHKYTLNYDSYSTIDDGSYITQSAAGDNTNMLLVNSVATNAITNLTTSLTNNRVKIEFYAYSNAGKYLKINDEIFTINSFATSDIICEYVNSNINIEFVDGPNPGSGSAIYQRHFTLYFTQTDDILATNYPELLTE